MFSRGVSQGHTRLRLPAPRVLMSMSAHLKCCSPLVLFCPRAALRSRDGFERHKHESTHLATKANSEIQKLTCAGLEDLGHFMRCFRLYRHQMGMGEHKLTNAMGISLLKDKLRGLNELKATFALWAAGSSTDLNGLIQAIESIQAEYLDEIEKRNNRKAERAAARCIAAAAKGPGKGKKGKDGKMKAKVTCGFCGKPNHDASQCWNNPQSASYRPQFAQKTGAHGAPSVPPGGAQPALRLQDNQQLHQHRMLLRRLSKIS